MIIAVTGAGGFLGRALTRELLERGHTPVPYDLPGCDIRGTCTFGAARHVIHLAGMLGTAELFDQVTEALTVNVVGTANVLEAARRGGAGYTGITMPHVFPSIYTASKIAAREVERAYHHAYQMPMSRVRAFNAYGPGQKHGPGHPQKIVPTFAAEAWAGRPIPIWGDGEQTVDLIHAADLARLLADATAFTDDCTIDGGTRTPLTVNQVAGMVLAITGSRAGVAHHPMRRGEIPAKIAAAGAGWDRLTWWPVFDEQRFAETVEWYRP
jgi:UDP-glucose 4-epimerase